MARREHMFQEEVRAALDGYIVSQQLAHYHLGLALDNRTLLQAGSRSDSLGWQGDGRIEFWQNGELPVSIFANRQATSFSSTQVPTSTSTSETYGYSVGVQPYRLPRIRTRGWWQSMRASDGESETQVTNSDLSATLTQSADAAVVRANVEWQRNAGPDPDQAREVRTGEINVDYRLNEKVEVVARGSTRSYSTSYGENPFDLTNEDSDLILRYRIDKQTRAAAYTHHYRNVFGDAGFAGASGGGQASRSFDHGFRGQVEGGISYDTANEAGEISRYTGENLRVEGSNGQSGDWGSVEVGASAGSAYFTEIGEGGGLQSGFGANASASRGVLSNLVRLNVGGDARRQWDSSPVNLDMFGWGWRAGLSTKPLWGTTLTAQAGQSVVDQLSQDEGDSSRLTVWGVASKSFTPEIRASYTFNAEQAQLDEQESRSLGHSARADAKVSQFFSVSAMIYQSSWTGTDLEPWSWWRAEGIAAFLTPRFALEARVSRDWSGGVGQADRGSTFVQAVVSRRFDWNL